MIRINCARIGAIGVIVGMGMLVDPHFSLADEELPGKEKSTKSKSKTKAKEASLRPAEPAGPLPAPNPLVGDALLRLHNDVRVRNGLPPLKHHPKLSAAAQRFAEFSVRKRRFGHQADGRTPADRIAAEGVDHRGWAENMAHGQPSPLAAMHTWLNSAGHRRNILGPHTHVGFGQVGGVWVTVFADVIEPPAEPERIDR